MKVEIEESKLQTAYANACDGVKDFMESLFGKKVFEAAKPTLDDYKTIRTYEDACKALGEPIFEDPNNLPNWKLLAGLCGVEISNQSRMEREAKCIGIRGLPYGLKKRLRI